MLLFSRILKYVVMCCVLCFMEPTFHYTKTVKVTCVLPNMLIKILVLTRKISFVIGYHLMEKGRKSEVQEVRMLQRHGLNILTRLAKISPSLLSLLFLFATLAVAPAQAATARTYWVDSSCSDPVPAIIVEAFSLAARAGVRNYRGSADANQASVFQRLFKVSQSDPTVTTPFGLTSHETVARRSPP